MTSTTSTPRSIVVTGANKGIGYEAVKLLAQKLPDATIYLTARSQANGNGALAKLKQSVPGFHFDNVHILLLEILDADSVANAVATVKRECGTLDVLLHNSGVLQVDGDMGAQGIFDVNVRAAKACIDAFGKILTRGTGKILVVSSEVGTWATHNMPPQLQDKLLDSKKANWQTVDAWIDDWLRHRQGKEGVQEPWIPVDNLFNSGYGLSKALLNAYLRHYAQQPGSPPIAIVCPGYCATELNNMSGPRSAAQGGESVCWPIFNEFQSGHFYQDGKELPFSAPPGQL